MPPSPPKAREVQHKAVPIDLKVDAKRRRIEGYASTFGNVDNGGDVVVQGAFTKTLQERFPRGLIKFLIDHHVPAGMPVVMVEDSMGLYTETEVAKSAIGDEFLANHEVGLYSHMSIGYEVILDETDRQKSLRYLKELRLYEYSAVLWPMNEMAAIFGAKSLGAHIDRLRARFESLSHGPSDLPKQDFAALVKSIGDLQASITSALTCSPPDSVSELLAKAAGIPGVGVSTGVGEPPDEHLSPEMYQLLHDGLLDLRRKALTTL